MMSGSEGGLIVRRHEHSPCGLQDLSGIRVAECAQRAIQRQPDAFGDAFSLLWAGFAAGTLDQEEMAKLVDHDLSILEVPVDRGQLVMNREYVKSGFLRNF